MARVDLGWALGSVVAYTVLVAVVESLRFALAARMIQAPQPGFASWVRTTLESRAFMYALPASAGSDGVVWLRLRGLGWSHSSCAYVLLFTRVLGVGVWALAGAASLSLSPPMSTLLLRAPPLLRDPMGWAGAGLLAIGAVLLTPILLPRFRQLDHAPNGLPRFLAALSLAVVSAAVNAAGVMAAAKAAHAPLSFDQALGLMAFFNFAMILPISLGGFGLQEALFLMFGSLAGFSAPAMFVCSALVHCQRLGLAATGVFAFLMGRTPAAAPEGIATRIDP